MYIAFRFMEISVFRNGSASNLNKLYYILQSRERLQGLCSCVWFSTIDWNLSSISCLLINNRSEKLVRCPCFVFQISSTCWAGRWDVSTSHLLILVFFVWKCRRENFRSLFISSIIIVYRILYNSISLNGSTIDITRYFRCHICFTEMVTV